MDFADIGDDARRQYIDARTVFQELERTLKEAGEVRGSMVWKTVNGTDYLVRTSPAGAQKSLGPRSPDLEAIHAKFVARKTAASERVRDLKAALVRQQRMNRALFVGRTPEIVVEILNRLAQAGIAEHFLVIGTHALYAYEQAAGVRIQDADAMATRDVDLLWDTRRRMQFLTQMAFQASSMLGVLQKADKTFRIRDDQRYTAINSKGFEVDILRREAGEGDPHPLKITEAEDDFWVVQARRAGHLQSAQRFSTPVVSAAGTMARMTTVAPRVFAAFKRWMAEQPDREPEKRSRDRRQADIVEQIAREYLPP
jgi:hypothetical protein